MLNGFRTKIKSFILGRTADNKPVIKSEHGITTEAARYQAAMNMKFNPEVKMRVEEHFTRKFGGNRARGIIEAMKYYPEAYRD